MPSAARVGGLVAAWYISSAFAVLVLKALFQGKFAQEFSFPLTITTTSNIVSFTIASFARPGSDDSPATKRYGAVVGAMTALEIGLSNWALTMLTVTLATMLKGAAPLLVMGWGIVLRVYRPSLRTALIVTMVSLGLVLAVNGSSASQKSHAALVVGVTMQLTAGVLSGLRWVVTQLFVKGEGMDCCMRFIGGLDHELHAIDVVRLTAPYTGLAVLPGVLALEAGELVNWFATAPTFDAVKVVAAAFGIGSCVFILLWAEYELVRCTSSLTVSVGFVAKEVMVIAAGILLFGDAVTAKSVLGFVLVQLGIAAYATQKENMGYDELPS